MVPRPRTIAGTSMCHTEPQPATVPGHRLSDRRVQGMALGGRARPSVQLARRLVRGVVVAVLPVERGRECGARRLQRELLHTRREAGRLDVEVRLERPLDRLVERQRNELPTRVLGRQGGPDLVPVHRNPSRTGRALLRSESERNGERRDQDRRNLHVHARPRHHLFFPLSTRSPGPTDGLPTPGFLWTTQ